MPVDDLNTIYSKTLKISSNDSWQNFNIKIDNTVIKLSFFQIVFEVVQGSAKVLNIKKTRKTREQLISKGDYKTGRIFLFPSRWAYN